jgi:hypothetical protein
MHIIIRHEGNEVGRVFTNRSLTTDETLRLAGIDVNEMVGGDPKWDYGKFEFEPFSDREYAAMLMGSATSEAKTAAARKNGKRGGRPKKQTE